METLCSAQQEVARLFPQWLYHPGSHQQCGRVPVVPHPCQHLLLPYTPSPKVVLSVKQYFTVAVSVSRMTNDSEQSPLVLVVLPSLDLLLCLSPIHSHLSKLAPSSWPGHQPAWAGSQGWVSHFWLLGCYFVLFRLFWLGRALNWHLGCSSDSQPSSPRLQALHLVLPSAWWLLLPRRLW